MRANGEREKKKQRKGRGVVRGRVTAVHLFRCVFVPITTSVRGCAYYLLSADPSSLVSVGHEVNADIITFLDGTDG